MHESQQKSMVGIGITDSYYSFGILADLFPKNQGINCLICLRRIFFLRLILINYPDHLFLDVRINQDYYNITLKLIILIICFSHVYACLPL